MGALESELLLQFLIEAVVLSALGGLVRILIATRASWGAVPGHGRALRVRTVDQPAVTAVLGRYRRTVRLLPGAARVDPIEALPVPRNQLEPCLLGRTGGT